MLHVRLWGWQADRHCVASLSWTSLCEWGLRNASLVPQWEYKLGQSTTNLQINKITTLKQTTECVGQVNDNGAQCSPLCTYCAVSFSSLAQPCIICHLHTDLSLFLDLWFSFLRRYNCKTYTGTCIMMYNDHGFYLFILCNKKQPLSQSPLSVRPTNWQY